jgi:hypothetical protein
VRWRSIASAKKDTALPNLSAIERRVRPPA